MIDSLSIYQKSSTRKQMLDTYRRRNYFYRTTLSRIRDIYLSQVNEVVKRLRGGALPITQITPTINILQLLDLQTQIYTEIAPDFAKLAKNSIDKVTKKNDEIEQWIELARLYAESEAANRVVNISNTIRNDITNIILLALDEGFGSEETAIYLQKQTKGISLQRARVIARTEILTASNYGQMLGYRSTGIELKKRWITARDSRVRDEKFNHVSMNGKEVPLDEPFIVSGERMMHPGDTNASAGNIINCRCVIAAIPV